MQKLIAFKIVNYLFSFKGINAITTYIKNEFKYLIEPGALDCFYQRVEKDAVFHSSIQVVKGDDVNFYIIDANHSIIFTKQRETSGYHQVEKSPSEGSLSINLQYTQLYFKSPWKKAY